jgi:mannitol/fructose-specific phosphotransferase system IIA component
VKQQTLLIAEREQTIIRLEKQLRNKDEVIRTLSTMLSSQPPVDQNKISSLNATSSVMLLDIDM